MVPEGFRLSPQQRSIWTLGSHGYTLYSQCVLLLEGNLSVERLRISLERVCTRHEILRTTYQHVPGYKFPIQVILPEPALAVSVESAASDQPLAEMLVTLRDDKPRDCIDLVNGPVVCARVIISTEQQSLLVLTLSALCADSPSLAFFTHEVLTEYATVARPSDDEPIHYIQFSEWQNAMLEEESIPASFDRREKEKEKFWRSNDLAQSLPLATMMRDKDRPGLVAPGITQEAPEHSSLKTLARTCSTSLKDFLLACWAVFLWRFSQKETLVIETAFDERTHPDLQQLIGACTRYLPVQLYMSPQSSVRSLIAQLEDQMRALREWQEHFSYPLPEKPDPVLFPLGFDFEALPSLPSMEKLKVSWLDARSSSAWFSLRLVCLQKGDMLLYELQADQRYYTKESLQCLAEQLRTFLREIAADPERIEMAIVNFLRNETSVSPVEHVAFPTYQSIYQLFEAQVTRVPDRLAVICEEEYVTYAALDQRARRIAQRISQLPASALPTRACALVAERTPDMLVGLLGILKAGAAFVPIEPLLPVQRIMHIVRDADVLAILTQRSLAPLLESAGVPMVYLDEEGEEQQQLSSQVDARDPAYIIYTSGSTGQPKGICIEHKQLLNYVQAVLLALQPREGASFATVSTLGADLGHTAIFGSLCSGASLHLVVQERFMDAQALGSYFARHHLDYLKITPTHLAALLAARLEAWLAPECQFILGGEALSWELVDELRQRSPSCKIFNHYGPAETTVGVLLYPVEQYQHRYGATVPLGLPLANTYSYILDADLQPLPPGIAGEIFIGGAGVARGYINSPHLTAEKFFPDPFSPEPGSRLYRSGDWGRQLPDKTLEFLGRRDHQIKVRGFRVELEEIERVLLQHPAVREAVVLPEEDRSAKRLIAYVTITSPHTNLEAIRDFAQQYLADYMVPHFLVELDVFPRTTNGKVDRQKLHESRPFSQERPLYVAPRNDTEAALVRLYAEILQVEPVGIHDDFFALGGDSITSILLASQAQQAGLPLTPRHLFNDPTIANLATRLEPTPLPQISQERVAGSVPLMPSQQRFFALVPRQWERFCDALLLEASSNLDQRALQEAFQAIVAHHDALRLRFVRTEQGWQQEIAEQAGELTIMFRDLAHLSAGEQNAALQHLVTEIQATMQLDAGPLLRLVRLKGLNEHDHLLVVWHYLIADATSLRILCEDLATAYRQIIAGNAVQLPLKTISFQAWSEYLVAFLRSPAANQELSYWREVLGRNEGRPVTDSSGREELVEVAVELSVEETNHLQQAPHTFSTQEFLLAALVKAASAWTGTPPLLVDIETNGREHETVAPYRTVGRFSTRYPFSFKGLPSDDEGTLLRVVQGGLRAVPSHGRGYGLLRYTCEDPEIRAETQQWSSPWLYFNYLGAIDMPSFSSSLWKRAQIMEGPQRGESYQPYRLQVSAIQMDGRLHLLWQGRRRDYPQNSLAEDVQCYMDSLRTLIAHKIAPETGKLMPTDFAHRQLSQSDLDEIIEQFGAYDGET